jgi:DNA-directed RNA polymerase subunit RPC12/RpoP
MSDESSGDTVRCRGCGSTRDDAKLIRMDDRVMPSPKQYECLDCIRSLQSDTDE